MALGPYSCVYCGKGEGEANFYPSVRYACRSCHRKRVEAARAKRPKQTKRTAQLAARRRLYAGYPEEKLLMLLTDLEDRWRSLRKELTRRKLGVAA